jgi:hypothetical protein
MIKLDSRGNPLGTFGNICFYEMDGKSYARKKSSLTRKRVLKAKEFEKTRNYASKMAIAARIGSVIYKALPDDIKNRWFYRAITGEAASLLYKGREEQEVKELLWKKYITGTNSENENANKVNCKNFKHSARESNRQLRDLFRLVWEKQGKAEYHFKQAWDKRGYFNRERFYDVYEYMNAPWRRLKR